MNNSSRSRANSRSLGPNPPTTRHEFKVYTPLDDSSPSRARLRAVQTRVQGKYYTPLRCLSIVRLVGKGIVEWRQWVQIAWSCIRCFLLFSVSFSPSFDGSISFPFPVFCPRGTVYIKTDARPPHRQSQGGHKGGAMQDTAEGFRAEKKTGRIILDPAARTAVHARVKTQEESVRSSTIWTQLV
jgi:hypothetical protein